MSDDQEMRAPVELIDTKSKHKEPEDGVALCLSGGGFRAMLFHVGVLWRLNEIGYLKKLKRISSVSGGSITAGVLGMNWQHLNFDSDGVGHAFEEQVVAPIRRFAGRTIDRKAILRGVLTPGSVGDKVAKAYRKQLFGDATLQDLPDDPPRFVINATNVQSGALWRFMKPYMRDWRVGEVKAPRISLARAVAASSAFPPVLSPVDLELSDDQFTKGSGASLQGAPYTTEVKLTDGGVYDNLGLETVWKRYKTILVSDAGGNMKPDASPKRNWASHTVRVLGLIDNQVRSLRKRQLIGSFISEDRTGAYWGIRSDIQNYGLSDHLDCPHETTLGLAATKTRLKQLPPKIQKRLINWGYAVSDAAIRAHVDSAIPAPNDFPYPKSRV